ncbi:MAG: LysE family transporter, partial [Campylobacteraceae bacterium]|nr:LysE family transporter [Campylobacteraceae bacterium]
MLDISILPVFFIAIFFLAISPGPDLLLLSSYSSAKGFKTGVLISLGICAAGISQTLLVAFGLGQMMQMFPALAWTIKLLGALYLTYLGLNLIKNWYKNKNSQVLTSTLKMAS